jgi:(2Fe-2S) ferredoxin
MKMRSMDWEKALFVCLGEGCRDKKARKLASRLEKLIKKQKLGKRVRLTSTPCVGHCDAGPVVLVSPDHVCVTKVKPADAGKLLNRLLNDESRK